MLSSFDARLVNFLFSFMYGYEEKGENKTLNKQILDPSINQTEFNEDVWRCISIKVQHQRVFERKGKSILIIL